MIEMELM